MGLLACSSLVGHAIATKWGMYYTGSGSIMSTAVSLHKMGGQITTL